MQAGKKNPVKIRFHRDYRRELDFLYARRTVVDRLIISLEQYARRGSGSIVLAERRKQA